MGDGSKRARSPVLEGLFQSENQQTNRGQHDRNRTAKPDDRAGDHEHDGKHPPRDVCSR
jgi:hypothetical protein